MVKVLFVCLGNICRSPTAEGVFRALVEREGLGAAIEIDSAGTAGFYVGKAPDRRAQAAARQRGIEIKNLRARQVGADDFHRFDYILAMDRENERHLKGLCPPGAEDRLKLFLDFAPGGAGGDMPDPYGGGADGFERVLDLAEAAAGGLLAHIRARL